MEANHPRFESEEKRVYARRKLRTLAESIVKRHGSSNFPALGGLAATDALVAFEDGLPGSVVHITGHDAIQSYDIIKINMYHTEDVLGPMTQYTSRRPGEFTRSDFDPTASGSLAMSEINQLPEDNQKVMAAFLGSAAAAMTQIENIEQGLDNHPISALEAREITEKLKLASIK